MSTPITTRPEALKAALDHWAVWTAAHGDKQVLALADLLSRPIPPELVEGLLVDGSVITLVSAPGIGKSFAALDLGLSIATGKADFVGRPLHLDEPAPVVYVLGEGAGRFNLRVHAWQQHYGLTELTDAPFYTWPRPLDLLNQQAVNDFRNMAREIGPKLIVLDTLSRCIAGHDENSQQVMSDACAAITDLKSELADCNVLVVHHLNAAGTRERGSSVLRAAVDTQLTLKPRGGRSGKTDDEDADEGDDSEERQSESGDIIRLSTAKQKDLEPSRAISLVKQEIALVNADGRPLTDRHGNALSSLVLTTTDQQLKHRIREFIQQRQPKSRREVYAERWGKRRTDVEAILDELKFNGQKVA